MTEEKLEKAISLNKIIKNYESVIALITEGSYDIVINVDAGKDCGIIDSLCITVDEESLLKDILRQNLETLRKEFLEL